MIQQQFDFISKTFGVAGLWLSIQRMGLDPSCIFFNSLMLRQIGNSMNYLV